MARRGENIHKRKDGRWEGRYIKARTPEGNIQWGYIYGTAYAEVKRVLIQKKAEAGFYNLKRTDLTFEALAEVWLHSLRNSIKESTYICVSNVHTTVTSFEDADYCAIQNGGLMAIPDGGPLSTVGQKRGHKNMERTTGPSLMGEIFEISAKKGYRHYFYGSKEETLELLYQKLTSNYPGIQVAGMYSPPFRPLTEEEDKAIIERINETKPDFVWVGLGAPKQEKWMAAHQGKIDGLMLGVGAGFDYYAENIKRAPMWMQKHNLEWVYLQICNRRVLLERLIA